MNNLQQGNLTFFVGICTGYAKSKQITLKIKLRQGLLPVNWQQRFYDEMAAAS